MKKLFILLLICNLGLFGWLYINETSVDGAVTIAPIADDVAKLQLLSEWVDTSEQQLINRVEPVSAPMPFVPPVAVVVEPPPSQDICFEIGPFKSDDHASQSAEKISAAGLSSSKRRTFVEERFGYWVLLPPYTSRTKALEAATKLSEMGIQDYFVVLASGRKNAVSLGVFKQKQSAVQRKRVIEKMGFKPQIEDRMKKETRYWLDYRGKNALSEALWSEIEAISPEAQLNRMACK
ncbi:hypothetical protein BOW53_08335 [Solemya pervernicosa gill symbiont]|uniref:SPOR domain-containing protein n=2 Tax=Gammaproteobacteria incertae sedis TaxID=118884 RepID=A0A1T2L589_9GAMM|nr:SPOR domain-containing protein [Candidatus Reidiella endopervernicosa]OOZ40249.1 hypothetical protein BOW53_08335 [Solemya pervernicosa gill symbiont]QKQ26056.1 SPOR domain-containing protein [Candidatus Reidiella endopervernicosa]